MKNTNLLFLFLILFSVSTVHAANKRCYLVTGISFDQNCAYPEGQSQIQSSCEKIQPPFTVEWIRLIKVAIATGTQFCEHYANSSDFFPIAISVGKEFSYESDFKLKPILITEGVYHANGHACHMVVSRDEADDRVFYTQVWGSTRCTNYGVLFTNTRTADDMNLYESGVGYFQVLSPTSFIDGGALLFQKQ